VTSEGQGSPPDFRLNVVGPEGQCTGREALERSGSANGWFGSVHEQSLLKPFVGGKTTDLTNRLVFRDYR
jgi:hypothetical protein